MKREKKPGKKKSKTGISSKRPHIATKRTKVIILYTAHGVSKGPRGDGNINIKTDQREDYWTFKPNMTCE